MKRNCLVLLISMSAMFFNCTSDGESEGTLTNIEGTVQGAVSCNTEGRGLAYEITLDNIDLSSESIITATLPDELKQEGVRIKFDMEPSKKYITFCTAHVMTQQFFEIVNVIAIDDQKVQ